MAFVRPHSALANRTPEEFRARRIAVAVARGNGQNFNPGLIIEAACWAHGRRKLFELAELQKAPIAIEAVRRIDELVTIEREINGLAPDQRLAVRTQRSKALVDDLEKWMRQERRKLSSRSPLAKALAYSLKRWPATTRFLDDGRICMTNNAAERAVRGIAMGRKNWTFAGSDSGGRRAAAIYTLIQTSQAQRRRSARLARRRARAHCRSSGQPHC